MSFLQGSSNLDYHADRTHLSSSSLKVLLHSKSDFYTKFILNQEQEPEKENSAFIEGNLLHSLILEPSTIPDRYAFYDGLRKAGKAFEEFKAANVGKEIVSLPQKTRAEKMYQSFLARPEAVAMVQGGQAELTMTGKMKDVALKVRHDYINVNEGYIIDVKSTSQPSGPDFFKETVHQYLYHLSADLYAKMAYQHTGKLFDFYWIVCSKFDNQTHIYKMHPHTQRLGGELLDRALAIYKICSLTNNWTDDVIGKEFSTEAYEITEI